MLKRYIVSTSGRKAYITKFYINLFDNVLRFGYNIYEIKNTGISSMVERIDASFRSNPEADNIFSKLPVEQVFSHNISQPESTEVITYLEQVIANPNSYSINNLHLKVILPYATLYYELVKVKLLYNFIKHFYDNYELIKLSFTEPKVNDSDNTNPKILVNEDNEDNLSSKIFNELVKQSPNNLVTFFTIKQLTNFYNNHNVKFECDEKLELKITVDEFTSNFMLFYSDLLTLINYNSNIENYDNVTFRKHIKAKINLLLKILIYIFENKNKLKNEEIYLYINLIIVFIYIYGNWFNNNSSSADIYRFTNNVINNLFNATPKYKIIKIINNSIVETDSSKILDISKINELSIKYNYLLHVDKESYLKNIILDYENGLNTNSYKFSNKLILNKPKLIDLSNLENNPPLKYSLISKTNSNTIITKAYEDLIFVNNSNNILPTYEFDNYLPKLVDVITNKIIPNINKMHEMVKLNASTLLIYNQFIEPHINNDIISIDEKLYLLYDICIPYIYDTFKVDKFIDYFH